MIIIIIYYNLVTRDLEFVTIQNKLKTASATFLRTEAGKKPINEGHTRKSYKVTSQQLKHWTLSGSLHTPSKSQKEWGTGTSNKMEMNAKHETHITTTKMKNTVLNSQSAEKLSCSQTSITYKAAWQEMDKHWEVTILRTHYKTADDSRQISLHSEAHIKLNAIVQITT